MVAKGIAEQEIRGIKIVVNRNIKEISVEGCPVIGIGASGTIYKIDDETIVKVFSGNVELSEVKKEQKASRDALVAGIPTAIPFGIVNVDGKYGLIYELLDSDCLADYVTKNPEKTAQIAAMHAKLLHGNFAARLKGDSFPNVNDLFWDGYEILKEYITKAQLEKLLETLNLMPDVGAYIHGDCHPKNVMLVNNELMLVDMGSSKKGHPIFEFTGIAMIIGRGKGLYKDTNFMMTDDEAFIKRVSGLDKEIRELYWDTLLESFFETSDPGKIFEYSNMIEAACVVHVVGTMYYTLVMPEHTRKIMIDNAVNHFIPKIDEACEILNSSEWIKNF